MIARADASRLKRPLSNSAWLLALTLALLTFGFVASRPPSPPQQGPPSGGAAAAQRAIDALTHPGPQPVALSLLPADFTKVTGIVPGSLAARDGTVRAVHVDGGCSTPWGDDNTKWDYGAPCKAHDLGYDLLRYADKIGQPLPPSVRASLDARLTADMHNACRVNPMNSPRTCQLVASLYSAGLVVNSWHQRWGPPVGDPIGPMLAGIAVIGCLLVLRLRGWLSLRRDRARRPLTPAAPVQPPASSWVTLGVTSLVLMICGESVVQLARWAGADESWLWPFTWLAQLAPVFFFAGGRANAAGWQAVLDAGGGYRQYLAHRASWLLRPALIFVVVTLVVPLALELLGIPASTNATIVRVALHPLWLLGVYLLTMVAAPVMLALHRRAAVATTVTLLGLVVLAELSANWLGAKVPHYLGAFGLALLAQQLAFGRLANRRLLVLGGPAGIAGLVLLTTVGGTDPNLLGASGAPPALAAPALAVLLLGATQLSLLGLFARPLNRLTAQPVVAGVVRFALRAPMSLYLGFLAAVLLLVTVVYLPPRAADALAWLAGPKTLMALGLLAVPAVIVFFWFERHGDGSVPPQRVSPTGWLAHAATALGTGFATIGLFGFALTQFGGAAGETMLGLPLDPIQNLIQLLLGVFLLHAVRTGLSAATSTWVVTALACVPPLLEVADGFDADAVTLLVHGLTALFAVAAAASTLLPGRTAVTNT
ncbi:phospholipase [Amycolatopsis pithecellobii]|uniref:Phospholipase n=1 Tax=Amycolatopsis pithecellobii TaxID=664692 RepID=A0A6N7Z9H9_9PSEU|nr:phospholipase [Amycolatopsis pithecellobii]MTD58398.1 phospholipase [Amycolatopsis pithecellobii]